MLLQRFRRPRWQHSDPAVRREAVARLDVEDPEQAGTLARLAVEDDDPGVRATAIRRVHDLSLLQRRIDEDQAATVRESARARYCQLLAGGDRLDESTRQAAISGCDDAQVIAHVARNAREETLRTAALERVRDSGVLAEAALHDPVARVRRYALERITDETVLLDLAERGRRFDRRVARVARERLDAAAQRRRERLARERELVELCERLEALADARPGAEADAERQRIVNRREVLGDIANQALVERYHDLLARVDRHLAEAARVPPPAPAAEAVPAEPDSALEDVIAELERADAPTVELLNRLQAALDDDTEAGGRLRGRLWLEAGRRYLTLAGQIADVDDDLHSLTELDERLDWPGDLPVPKAVAALRERIAQWRRRESEQQADDAAAREAERRAALAALDEALDSAERALEAGELRRSRRAVARLRRTVAQVPGSLDPGREHRVARARAQLAELRDWRQFAVAPKQESLCEEMERLGEGDGFTPEARLTRIRELHEAWKQTGGSDSARTRALWQRFQTATEHARESCQDWLEQEAARRERNREGRETVCTQLAEFMANADRDAMETRELDRIRRTARKDWQNFTPVDTRATRELTRRFEGLMDELSGVIDQRRDEARVAKEGLVEEARGLAAADDPEQAAQEAKALQRRWKEAGPARPGPERALWKRFREACDEIFARRDEARAARRARGNERVAEAEALCAELEQYADEGGQTSSDTLTAAVEAARRHFDTITLPDDRVGHGVARRFERACRAADERARTLRAEEGVAVLDSVREAATACRDALERGAPETVDLGRWLPDDGRLAPVFDALQSRLERGDGASVDGEFLRSLCVRMEILGGVDSPAEDSARRMELQVERLSQGLSQRQPSEGPDAGLWDLVAEWYGAPGQPGAFEERFHAAARAALRQASGSPDSS